MTQPIRLVLAHLLQDCLAKLAEHAAHLDVVCTAIAQHDLRVTAVTEWLQGQAVRVLEPIDRSFDASKQLGLVRDCAWPPELQRRALAARAGAASHPACGQRASD